MTNPMSVFEKENKEQSNQDVQTEESSKSAFTDQLALIKNERGEQKYATVEDALKALSHSQSFISTLESENSTLKDQATSAAELESKVAALTEQLTTLTAQRDQSAHQPQGLDEAGIATLVQNALQAEKQNSQALQNEKRVSDVLSKRFGDTVSEKLTQKAQALNMTVESLQSLARTSPEAVLAFFPETPASPQPMAGGHLTDVFQSKPETHVKRNSDSVFDWGSDRSIYDEHKASSDMVNELHSAGLTINDLSNPKNFAKVFGKI